VISPANRLASGYEAFLVLDTALADAQADALRSGADGVDRDALDRAFDRVARNGSFADDVAGLRRTVLAEIASAPSTQSLDASLASARTEVKAYLPRVASSIRSFRTLSFLVSGCIIALVWVLGVLLVRYAYRSLSRSSAGFAPDSASDMAGLPSSARIARFREDVGKSVESGASLSLSLNDASSTFEVVDGFIESIKGETQELARQVSLVKTGLEQITQGLSRLDEGIVNQKAAVTGSLSSVNRMIDSVGGMFERANFGGKAAEELKFSSDRGQTTFAETYERITAISDSVSRISDMSSVIADIAERTNMLALNAAIEAAHAGESGKGFAVVAEEISKLAEASSESSREISESIEGIIGTIKSMAASGGDLDGAFDAMETDIQSVIATIRDFREGLAETSDTGGAALGTMRALKDVSDGVTRDSGQMAQGALGISDSMAELEMISARVSDGVSAMSLMLDGLKDVMKGFKSTSDGIRDSGIRLSEELERL
jgi:methyl-accepting chemotaxis protein